ncbi:helix-turn-helix domain-containing protein [Kitasatospora purpeofusca]|uniref:helix-turn-helix domain-containing protein n=1 Tax=Kitasatospora purpeofusca TaxID=67352 RepID=UPI00386F6783|nr:helix-turn-helix domain-containing protein [Kitasatospora purpeofusca]
MRPVGPTRAPAPVWDIATPPRPGRIRGVGMAGFRAHAPVDLDVVPYPAVTVALDLGDPPLAVDDATGRRAHGSVVVGLAPGSVRGHGSAITCLQLRLAPPVAHRILGASSELAGTVVGLDQLWGRDAARTEERLRAASSWDERFAIAEAALLRRYADGRPVDPEVAFAWDQLVTHRGAVRIERIATEIGWSRKRLWSRFHTQTGLGPKHAARLVRFDDAAHRLAAGHSAARVAADTGYTDQSHLHRDIRTFTGSTPTTLATAPWLTVDPTAWPTTRPDGGRP